MANLLTTSGYGYGSGSGSGYGSGCECGCGCGSGYGDTEVVATIAQYSVEIVAAFRVVIIGCQSHTLDHWRKNWRQIASDCHIKVNESDVKTLFTLLEKTLSTTTTRECEEPADGE